MIPVPTIALKNFNKGNALEVVVSVHQVLEEKIVVLISASSNVLDVVLASVGSVLVMKDSLENGVNLTLAPWSNVQRTVFVKRFVKKIQ